MLTNMAWLGCKGKLGDVFGNTGPSINEDVLSFLMPSINYLALCN